MSAIRFLSADDVSKALTMKAAVDAVRDAFVQLSNREADVPLRTTMELPRDGGALVMPVHLPGNKRLGLKVITVVPENPGRGLPTTQALVTVFDAETGRAEAVMDGEVLTAVRTGAASGVATDALAKDDAAVAAVIGGGVQGRRQLEAMCAVRPIREALIFDADQDNALRYADVMGDKLGIPVRVLHEVSGVGEADVICTATSSSEPVVRDRDISPGTHINAIGTYRPDTREIPGETVARSRLVVDSRKACLAEAGDLVMAVQEGLLNAHDPPDEIGEVLAGRAPGRQDRDQLTLFKSVGNAVQDLAVAIVVLEEATKQGLGAEVEL
jgi:ornithine cyclodeaminase/alanine dehydrogenase-like protein (mu-crystallin family)